MTKNPPRLTIDMETRSACNLKATGTWRYSIDDTTDVLCVAFRLPYWEKGRTALWAPAFRHLGLEEQFPTTEMEELVEWLRNGGLIESHNLWFEWCMWQNILVPRYGWPALIAENCRCSAAKAASYALPRGLDDAASALHLKIRKDEPGSKIMKKVRSPRKSLKKEREAWLKSGTIPPALLWHESRELFEGLWTYCRIDVLAEEAVSEALEDLNEEETATFLLDLEINARGFQLDREAVVRALALLADESARLNRELSEVTNGYVDKASQRENMKLWLATEGLTLYDTQGTTIDDTLRRGDLTPNARRALEIMRALGRSSTAKYTAMQNWAGLDWRVRGGLLYHGASTGRWSGKGVQPHNFPRLSPKPKDQDKDSPTDIETLWEALKTATRRHIISRWSGVMEALSAALRGAITAREGHQLYVADFAGIEARVLLWCAGDERGLDLFRNKVDPYCDMAESIFNRPVTKADKMERGIGKIAILGLGYQMGAGAFTGLCEVAKSPIPEDCYCEHCGKGTKGHRKENHRFQFEDGQDEDTITGVKVVDAYREKYYLVKRMWEEQEASAIAAVQTRSPVQCGPVRWALEGKFLYCYLPSGRRLAYYEPQVKSTMMPWGKMKDVLSHMGVHPKIKQWMRLTVYGGLLTENIVQAVARDLMACGMHRAEATGVYKIVLTIHDELVAEALGGSGSVKEFEDLMAALPSWAAGCPVSAEGWCGNRYRK